jgi:hypothetical protein
MHPSLVLATALAAALGGFPRAQSPGSPCYEATFGTLLGSADDVVFPAITLQSPFPLFGTLWLQAEVSSNGFVWLGANHNPDTGCCTGSGAGLAAGATRICALWNDLVTDGVAGSGVYHNSLPGREVITWANAFESYDPGVRFTVQLQLINSGVFTVWYHPNTTVNQIPHVGVCGVSPGGVADPGSTDFSASFPHNSGAQRTLYEAWPVSNFDLAARTFEFVPNATGGWLLQDRPSCPFVAGAWATFGQGCPPPSGISGASFYELFTGSSIDLANLELELTPLGAQGYLVQPTSGSFFTGYSNAVPMQDDQVVDQTMPFPFVHPGGVCTTAGFCSNGFVWLDNFNNAAPAAPYVPAFLFDGPRISALWTDLDLTAFGTAYFDTTPAAAIFTWLDAADFGNPSLRSTFQVQLFADGRIKLCYRGIAVGANRPILAGYGLGGATWDPGSIDITASMPFSTGTGVLPVTLDAIGVRPVLGASFPLQVDFLRPSAVAGFLVLGLVQHNPGISLAAQGMPNCFQHTSVDATQFFLATPPATVLNLLAFPGNAAFAGLVLHAQVAVVDPGITPLGIAVSNGGTMTLGLY